ncbi:hypothetical protein MUK42_33229 [Musa troglodytarum]|uniref:Uncharacterized protein n=1 Tax=Musa troglodytarum TaxID=320322 RepID=A0A9E7III7_9LILI|nr:hypothetical protein MUK42_33229 [Musa troglodytarum]
MAFQCLSEAVSRERYDLCGSEEPALGKASSRHGFDDDDFDADEMLRSFFFGGIPQAAARLRCMGMAFECWSRSCLSSSCYW